MSWITHPKSSLSNVLAVQSGSPELLRSHVAFYRQIMFAPGGLSRREREMVATAVSIVNRCFY